MTSGPDVDAGRLSSWLDELRQAVRSEGEVRVPCAGCTACCRSSQFIEIGGDETETLARIPPELLFPAPLRSDGRLVMGYDEHGRCPMFIDERCSIYDHRPRACRNYDCRVFAAAGVEPEGAARRAIAERVRRWRFDLSEESDRNRARALRAAALFLQRHPAVLVEAGLPPASTAVALAAVEIHELFASGSDGAETDAAGPDEAEVVAVLRARTGRRG